ncbi:hypothetical protein LV89_00086 [Arcicella aurantiaca]|uniref:Uncharacterized protein n=1 Tax=Arcicella aurantiaca TaxID=591202 RepID=A0A316EE21_9BACT|nr:hypothetical protein LV89_00086 [Arcicella aurantiaca]
MVKILISLLITLSCFKGYSQSNFENTYKKVKSFYITNAVGQKHSTFFVNKADNIIEIADYQIPIFEVKCEYERSERGYHWVEFNCFTGNCIYRNKSDKPLSGFGIKFKSKEDCYTFINLISDLKDIM